MVRGRGRSAVNVERNAEVFKTLFYHSVEPVYHVLRTNALFSCPDRNGHAVFVATSDKHHVLVFQSHISCVDVGRHVNAGQVSDMHAAIGVRQGSCDGGSFVLFLFHCTIYNHVYLPVSSLRICVALG